MEEVTQGQIDQWKAEHKVKFIYKHKLVGEDGATKLCYLKRPDRQTISFASVSAQKNPMKFNEIILENAWIDGDPEIKTDNFLFMGIAPFLAELVKGAEVEVAKL